MSFYRKQSVDVETEQGDLVFENGDFSVFGSDDNHMEDILISEKGNWREHPLLGVGLIRYLNGSVSDGLLRREIRLQFQYDRLAIRSMDITDVGRINIKADRL